MGNACRSFDFDENQGMRVFAITEMFLACYHVITAMHVYRYIVEDIYRIKWHRTRKDYETAILVLGFLFMVTLIFQAVSGFLLYMKGWKERNVTVCYVWMVVAAINITLSSSIGLTDMIGAAGNSKIEDLKSDHSIEEAGHLKRTYWNLLFLYLLYGIYGIWVVWGFIKWALENEYPNACCCCCCNGSVDEAPVHVTVHSSHPSSHSSHHGPSHTPKSAKTSPSPKATGPTLAPPRVSATSLGLSQSNPLTTKATKKKSLMSEKSSSKSKPTIGRAPRR